MPNPAQEAALAALLESAQELPCTGVIRQIPGHTKSSFFYVELGPEWQDMQAEFVQKVAECYKYDKAIEAHAAKLITKLLSLQDSEKAEKKSNKGAKGKPAAAAVVESRASLEQKVAYYPSSAGGIGLHISLAEDTKKSVVGKQISFKVLRVFAQAHPLAVPDTFQPSTFHSYRFCFEVELSIPSSSSSSDSSSSSSSDSSSSSSSSSSSAASSSPSSAPTVVAPSLTISSASTADICLRSTSHITFAYRGINR